MNFDRLSTALIFGTTDHAASVAKDRHPGVQDGLQWLTYGHLPPPLRRYSEPFYVAACQLLAACTTDSPELTTAINGLIAAKDSAMRAGIRHDTGRAGSVPRPQTVVDPPSLVAAADVECPPTCGCRESGKAVS